MQYQDFKDLSELESTLWWFVGMEEISKRLFSQYAEIMTARSVCDVGCGTGGNLRFLRQFIPTLQRATGVDISSDALQFCAASGVDAHLVEASSTDLPLPDNEFDLVTSFDVFAQITKDGSEERMAAELCRITKPGGYLFIRTAALQWLRSDHDVALHSQYRYTTNELRDLFERCGCQVLRTTYANTLLLPIVIMHRLILKKLGLTPGGSDVKPLPAPLNTVFTAALQCEAAWLTFGNLPIGSSAILIAKKVR